MDQSPKDMPSVYSPVFIQIVNVLSFNGCRGVSATTPNIVAFQIAGAPAQDEFSRGIVERVVSVVDFSKMATRRTSRHCRFCCDPCATAPAASALEALPTPTSKDQDPRSIDASDCGVRIVLHPVWYNTIGMSGAGDVRAQEGVRCDAFSDDELRMEVRGKSLMGRDAGGRARTGNATEPNGLRSK